MKQGRIITIISNSYQVEVEQDKQIYCCSVRGKIKQEEQTPVVGDFVKIEIIEEAQKQGVILEIVPRKNYSKRPKIANLTQLVFVVSLKMPKPDLLLLDKQLAYAKWLGIKPVICINKIDLAEKEDLEKIKSLYEQIGYLVLTTNAKQLEGIEALKKVLKGEVTAFSGNSGVGKSTLLNALFAEKKTIEGMVSEKIKRGKNTTTAVTLYPLEEGGYIADTPGFSTFSIEEIETKALDQCFIEFKPYIAKCQYVGCSHKKEEICGIKEALTAGKIAKTRYENYCKIYEELKEKEDHKW
ncbi:MAG: ribosome small subunit-dependent GTPase A [Clostridia bacterium]